MSRIDEQEVKKIAKLSRLSLDSGQISDFSHQLSEILDYVDKLNQLNVDGVEPLAHCLAVDNIFRQDVVVESLGSTKAVANAPATDGEYFIVPKIIDEMTA